MPNVISFPPIGSDTGGTGNVILPPERSLLKVRLLYVAAEMVCAPDPLKFTVDPATV